MLLALPLAGCATRKVADDQIEDRITPSGELLPHLKGEAQPFTGILVTHHDNGQKESEESYRNGIRSGWCRYWHPNGKLAERCYQLNGAVNGKNEEWYENGQRKSLAFARDNQIFGECTEWHANGNLKCKSWTDDDGNTTKEIHWYPSGQKRCVRIWEDSGWTYLEEWDEDGNPMKGTAEQRNALDS